MYSVTAAGHQCIGRYLNHGDETPPPPAAAAAARQQKSGIEYEEQQQLPSVFFSTIFSITL